MLEFLGIDEKAKYVESELDTVIINKLHKFFGTWEKVICLKQNKSDLHSRKMFGYKLALKILKTKKRTIILENIMIEKSENTPLVTRGSPNLIREGDRTVGSDRVAAAIE